jgi:O-antigen ligase/polysaccharide polymerase Wzy-like membrane protein
MMRRNPATTLAQPTIVGATAIVYAVLSLADGGYSHQLIGGGTAVIWLAVGIAVALGGWPRSRIPGSAIAAGACLAGFAAWTALSVAWASDAGRAFVEAVRVLGYLGLFVLVVVASPRGSARAWLTGLAVGLTAVAALALLSRFEPSFGEHALAGERVGSAEGRLSYPIGYWNGLGACMALALVLLTWLGVQARTPLGRAAAVAAMPLPILTLYFSSSRGGVIAAGIGLAALVSLGPARPRLLGGLCLGGAGGGLLVLVAHQMPALVDDLGNGTAARQGDELLVVTLLVVVAIGLLRLWVDRPLARVRTPRKVMVTALVVTGIAVVASLAAANPAARWEDFKTAGTGGGGQFRSHLVSDSSSGRYQYWSTALDAFSTSPVKGIGAGAYEAWWIQRGSLPRPIRDAHSLFIETLAELGIVGLTILVAFFGVVVVSGIQMRKRSVGPETHAGGWASVQASSRRFALGAALAVLVAGVISAAIEWTWELPACFGPVVVVAALLTGPAVRADVTSRGGATSGSAATGRLPGLGIVTLLVAWTAIWAGGVLFLTEFKLNASRDAANSRDFVGAADDARQAGNLQPWAAEPLLQLALVQGLGQEFNAANRTINEAIDRAPDDYRLWLAKAGFESRLGHKEASKQAMDRVRGLNPKAQPLFGR